MKKAFYLVFCSLLTMAGCTEKVEPSPEEIGYSYYPLEQGTFRTYNVTEIKWLNNDPDTLYYQIKERIDSVFTDQTGETFYKMIRSRRPDESRNWRDDSVIVVNKSNSALSETRNNIKRVKLVFPVSENKTWDMNAFNDLDADKSTYTKVGASYSLPGHSFDKTVTVRVGEPVKNLLEQREWEEVYANNIGLVFKDQIQYTYCNDPSLCNFGVDEIVIGTHLIYELESAGRE